MICAFVARWRSGYAEVCKTLYTGSIPVRASNVPYKLCPGGGMVDTRDLKSLGGNSVWVRYPPRAPSPNKNKQNFLDRPSVSFYSQLVMNTRPHIIIAIIIPR